MSTTVTVFMHTEPKMKGMTREYKASIKKDKKTYWLVDVEGYTLPWKFSKSDNMRIKPEYDQRDFELLIQQARYAGTVDILINEALENHMLNEVQHKFYEGKMLGLSAGVFACFGMQHELYGKIQKCQKRMYEEWEETIK